MSQDDFVDGFLVGCIFMAIVALAIFLLGEMSTVVAFLASLTTHVLVAFIVVSLLVYGAWKTRLKTRHEEAMRRLDLREKEIEEYGGVLADGGDETEEEPDFERPGI